MLDTVAWVTIVIRSIALLVMLNVGHKQFKLLKTKSDVQYIKHLLIFLVLVIIFNHAWSLWANFFRTSDGNLRDDIRHLSMIFNATSGLASAIGWHVLYKDD